MARRSSQSVEPESAEELIDRLASPGASSRMAYRLQMAGHRRRRSRTRIVLGVIGALLLLALGAGGYALFGPGGGESDAGAPLEASPTTAGADLEAIEVLLQGIGYDQLEVYEREGTVFVSGSVPSDADRAAVIAATSSLANGAGIDTTGVVVGGAEMMAPGAAEGTAAPEESVVVEVDPLQRLQVLLNRTVAANPIIFEQSTTDVRPWHQPTLDRVAAILAENPGIAIVVVGHADGSGAADYNQALSEDRAEAVRGYLVDSGLDPGILRAEARGASESTGLRDVGYLERRVEFEVVAASTTPLEYLPLQVSVILPSPRDDLAFSQSMVDSLTVLGEERGGLTVSFLENMADVESAELEAGRLAEQADVVILHGSQYRSFVEPLAQKWPNVVFVVGPSELDTDLPNVFVYSTAAEQGAYVMGDLAADLSRSDTLGIVGPIPVPEPQRFVEGFRLGAEARGATVLAEYAGSFNDAEAAAAIAATQLAAGADVLTGTSQLTSGPVEVARREGALWFANQANQTSLAPDAVVASQVYHFEVALREILAEIDANAITGGSFPLTLGNGGMLIEFNPAFPLTDEQRDRTDELLLDIAAGSIPINVDLDQ